MFDCTRHISTEHFARLRPQAGGGVRAGIVRGAWPRITEFQKGGTTWRTSPPRAETKVNRAPLTVRLDRAEQPELHTGTAQ